MSNLLTQGVLRKRCRFFAYVICAIFSGAIHAEESDTQKILKRLEMLEHRMIDMESRPGPAHSGNEQAQPATPAPQADNEKQALIERLEFLEKRLSDLESSTVLSEPETRVKTSEVWVDSEGKEYDKPVEGAKKTIRYQRERA